MHPVKLETPQEEAGETTPPGRSEIDFSPTTHEELMRWSPLIERKPSFTMPTSILHEFLAAPVGDRTNRLAPRGSQRHDGRALARHRRP